MEKLSILVTIFCFYYILICQGQNVGNNETTKQNETIIEMNGTLHLNETMYLNETVQNKNETKFEISQYLATLIDTILPKNYSKNLRPNHGGKRTIVNVSIVIDDISAISETAMEYKLDFHIRHDWNDYRLAYPEKHNVTGVLMGEDWAKKIWIPDTTFLNSKELNVHKTVSSDSTTMFNIQSNGNVMYITWLSSVARCPMDLTFFPLDQQKCSIDISSYGFKYGLTYRWADAAVKITPGISFPAFRLVGYSKFVEITKHIPKMGNATILHCDLFLARSIGYYVSQVYIPAFLVVVISWVPFWLDRNDHHARVALGVTTVLTMTTLITNSQSDFPKISYLKAIDIYLFTSFVMVFLSLIEYASVGYFDSAVTKCVSQKIDGNSNNNVSNSNDIELVCKRKHMDTSNIDKWARWLFPCSFIAFNIIYVVTLSVLVSVVRDAQNIQVKL